MVKSRLSFSDIFLIIINLVPLYGVWFENWDPIVVFIVYCMETLIAGGITIIKISLSSIFTNQENLLPGKKTNRFGVAVFLILFFILHYGIFVVVQTQIFLSTAGIGDGGSFFGKYEMAWKFLGNDGYLMLFIFIAWYTYDLVTRFLIPGEYRKTSPALIMFQPYGRIFVQQVIVILGSGVLMLKMPHGFILIFVAVKTFADLMLNRYMNNRMKDATEKNGLTNE